MPPKKKKDFASEFGVGRMQFEEPPSVDAAIGGDVPVSEIRDRALVRAVARPEPVADDTLARLLSGRNVHNGVPIENTVFTPAGQRPVQQAPSVAPASPSTTAPRAATYSYDPAANKEQTAKKFDGPMTFNTSKTAVTRMRKTPNAELMDAHGRARNDASAFQHQATEGTRNMGELTKKYEESVNATKKWYDGKKEDQGVNELIESQGAKDAYAVAQQEYQEAAARGVDPGKIWKDMGGAATAMTWMFAALGEFGAALSGRKNAALNIIMSAVDRDIAAQRGQIGRTAAAKKDKSAKAWRNIDRVTQELGIDRAELHKERAMRLNAFGDIYGKKIAQAGRNVNIAQANAGAEAVKAAQLLSASASLASTTSSRTVSGQVVNPAYAAFMKTPKYKGLDAFDKKAIQGTMAGAEMLSQAVKGMGYKTSSLFFRNIPNMEENEAMTLFKVLGRAVGSAQEGGKLSDKDAPLYEALSLGRWDTGETAHRKTSNMMKRMIAGYKSTLGYQTAQLDPGVRRKMQSDIKILHGALLLKEKMYRRHKSGLKPGQGEIPTKRVGPAVRF